MTLNIINDIKERSRRNTDEQTEWAKKLTKIRKNIVPLKWTALFILAVLPIFTMPNWCIDAGLNTPGFHKNQCDPDEYPNSNFTKFPPAFTTTLNIVAYLLLSTFVAIRLMIKKRSTSAWFRSIVMFSIMFICTVDLIWVDASDKRSTTPVVNIFNVCLILFFVRAIREVWGQFVVVVVKSVPVFAILMAYFVIYIIVGFIFFANSEED